MFKKKFSASVFLLLLLLAFNSFAEEVESPYNDGIYEASHSFITAEVIIDNGLIEEVNILSHGGGGERYRRMIEPLTWEIIETQSVEVDSITGATVSSEHLKEAVRKALRKAEDRGGI